jgi:hypothetical protein
MAQSMNDCPILPLYFHANIRETSCVLAVRPDLVKIQKQLIKKTIRHSLNIEWINTQDLE